MTSPNSLPTLCNNLNFVVWSSCRFHDFMSSLPQSIEVVIFSNCYLYVTEVLRTNKPLKMLPKLKVIHYVNGVVLSSSPGYSDQSTMRSKIYASAAQVMIPRLDHKKPIQDLCSSAGYFSKRDDIKWNVRNVCTFLFLADVVLCSRLVVVVLN